jgi:hypothetical protein
VSRRRKLPPLHPGCIRTSLVAIVCTERKQQAEEAITTLSGAGFPGKGPSLMSTGRRGSCSGSGRPTSALATSWPCPAPPRGGG